MSEVEQAEPTLPAEEGWRLRPLLLALLGLATGLAVHFLMGDRPFYEFQPSALTLAQVTAITVAAGLTGFTIERRLWWAAVLFALALGVLGGLVMWWNGNPQDWSGGDGWRTVSLFLGIAIAAPLFQAARDTLVEEGRPRFPYASVHDHAWTNVVLWCACWVFVGIVFLLAWLLAELFDLIKIHFLSDLLRENWFARALIGLAFGAGLGLLREHGRVVRLLQRVVATVLAVLAPVLAIGLVLFVLALPFTGLDALWDATSATTPLLLSCVIGALILANAVIGNAAEEERRFPPLRFAAMGLGAVILPLSVIAAIATGLRIGQYGFTPDRLWALTFVVIACAYGLAYLVSLVRGRLDWAAKLRPANLNLAFALCGIALLLATPLISFNAISTRDQVARLESGKITPDEFDWRALAFDFGQPGRDALAKLKGSANAGIRAKAIETAKAEDRWDIQQDDRRGERRARVTRSVRVIPGGGPVPETIRDLIADDYQCNVNGARELDKPICSLFLTPGAVDAFLLLDTCFEPPAATPSSSTATPAVKTRRYNSDCGLVAHYRLVDGKWTDVERASSTSLPPEQAAVRATGFAQGKIEVRPVERRQVFVGGVPVGDAFE